MTVIHRLVELVQDLGLPVGRWPDPASLSFHLRQLIKRYGIDLIIDVGGHHGEYARLLRREAHYDGDLVSFEPAESSFSILSRTSSRDARWRVERLALGEQAGTATLQHYHHSMLHSLSKPSDFGSTEWNLAPHGTEEVEVARLDTIELGLERYSAPMLKIDTQGFDIQVLRGASEIVSRLVAIQLELSVLPLYESSPDCAAVLEELNRLGFSISGLFPVAHDADLRAVEFDCIAVRAP